MKNANLNSKGEGDMIKVKPGVEKWISLPFPYLGSLQIRYNLGGTREPFDIDVDHRNMANGQPHSVNITRHEKTIILKVYLCMEQL